MSKTQASPPPISDDMKFQQRAWVVERAGWLAMTLFVALGLLGVFFSGLLSDTTVATQDRALVVTYQRFEHRTKRSHFTIRVAAPLAGEVSLRLGASFARAYDIESLTPQPVSSTAGAAGLELDFAPSTAGDLSVEVAARAKRFGILRTEIAVQGRGSVAITQIIYP
jgi:hypothetical protein